MMCASCVSGQLNCSVIIIILGYLKDSNAAAHSVATGIS